MRYVALPLLITALVTPGVRGAEIVDRIVATVDTEVILQSDIMEAIGPELNDLQSSASSQEAFDRQAEELIRRAVNQAVENRILRREALLAGMEVREEQVDEYIDRIRGEFTSTDAFLRELESAGVTVGDLRDRHRRQLLAVNMAMAKRREFARNASITESDVAQYYADHKDEFGRPERVWCRQIFIPARTPDERERARARLTELLRRLEAGEDFEALARQYSEAPGAEEGGAIGWVTRGDLRAELERAVFTLPQGSVSGIIEGEWGLHVVKVDSRQEASTPPFEELRAEIEPILREQAAEERYREWMNSLRERSRVRILY